MRQTSKAARGLVPRGRWASRAPSWAACAALLAVTACGGGSVTPLASATPGQIARAVSVRAVPVSVGAIGVSTSFPAAVEAQEAVNISPLSSGLIQRLNVDVGAEVKRGDVLGELSHGTLDVQLTSAKAQLDQLLNPSAVDLQAMVSGVATALAALDTAKSQFDALVSPSVSDVAAAQSAVATAQSNLVAAQVKLDQLKHPIEADVAASQSTLAAAQTAYVLAESTFDTALRTQITAKTVDVEVSTLTNALFLLHANLETHQQQLANLADFLGHVPSHDELAAARQLVSGDTAQVNSAYQLLIRTQPATIAPYPLAITYAWLAEGSAKASQDSASAKLAALLNPDANAIVSAQASLASNQAAYESAVAKLKALQSPEARTISLSQNTVATAKANLDAANARLSLLKSPSPASIALAKAAVESLQTQLEQTRVVAPFDGLITQRLLNTGALATAQTPIYSVTSKAIVVSFSVDEANVGNLKPGLTAAVSSPGVPGKPMPLPVTRVAPTANAQVHTFLAQIVTDMDKTHLKPGMSAQVSITNTHDKALLVPREAVVALPAGLVIYRVIGGMVRATNVSLGLTDDRFSEVLAGVVAGDLVVVSPQNTLREGDQVTVAAAPNDGAGGAGGRPKPQS